MIKRAKFLKILFLIIKTKTDQKEKYFSRTEPNTKPASFYLDLASNLDKLEKLSKKNSENYQKNQINQHKKKLNYVNALHTI